MLADKSVKTDNKTFIQLVKELIEQGNFTDAEKYVTVSMAENPHNALPHNLMGILMEHKNNHCLAMKHFRAALALDPSFYPARYNMEKCGSFGNERFNEDAYEESDCKYDSSKTKGFLIEYDNLGIGHFVKKI